jgi:hypothetical protein
MSIITSAERVGIKKGKNEGKVEGLHESISDIFEIKFGKNIYELFAQVQQILDVQQIQDIEILQNIRLGLKKAQTLEETENLILLQLSNWQKK